MTDVEHVPEAESDPSDDGDDNAEPVVAASRRRRPDKGLFIASLVIAGGLALIVWGFFTAITGTEGIDRPAEVESVSPVENAVQVLQQESIVVDLEFGYEARLIVDGITLETTNIGQLVAQPGQQLELPPTAIFDPGNGVLSFQPNENAVIKEFTQGRHQARVEYWKIEDGPDTARSYNWSFNVV